MDMILHILLLFIIFLIWTLDRWIALYRLIRRKNNKRILTKRERKLNKTYNKIRNDRTSNN